MNASELYAGNVFSSYRDMSKRLFEDEKPKTHNSKIAEFKILDSLCEYHKIGNKIILDNIFPIPHNIKDIRTFGNNNKYTSLAKEILLLSYSDGSIVRTSTTNLLSLLGLTTQKYIEYKQYDNNDNIDILDSLFTDFDSNLTKEDKKTIIKFVNFVYHKKVAYLVPYVLKSMKKYNEIVDYTNKVYYYQNYNEEWVEDDKEIIKSLLNNEKECIIEMNAHNTSALYNDYKVNSTYYRNVRNQLQKQEIYNYYRPYVITFKDTLTGIGQYPDNDKLLLNRKLITDLKNNIDKAICYDINELREECKHMVDILFNVEYNNNRFVNKDDCKGVIIDNDYSYENMNDVILTNDIFDEIESL